MKRILTILLLATICQIVTSQVIQSPWDDDATTTQRPIRRLHPEREREKALKRLQQEQAQKAAADSVAAARAAKSQSGDAGENLPISDKEWLNELLSVDYSTRIEVPQEPQRMVWTDDSLPAEPQALRAAVSASHPQAGTIRYMPHGAAMSRTENAIFFYFDSCYDHTGPLRLRLQYYADDPLNFSDVLFTIDGFDYAYHAASSRRGKGMGRMICETVDAPLVAQDKDLVYALAHAHWVRMSLMGEEGIKHVKMLTPQQIEDFNSVLKLYRALQGVIE